MEAKYITPFVHAVKNVFKTMLQVEVELGEPLLRRPGEPAHDVSGIIGMSGELSGTVVLSFPTDTACRIVSLFVGMEVDSDSEDFADAVGELVNMVTGNAKAEIQDGHVNITCPSIVVGQSHTVFQQKNRPVIELPCDCSCGEFCVMISIVPTDESKRVPAHSEAKMIA